MIGKSTFPGATISPISLGLGLMVISTLIAPGIDVFSKLATDTTSPGMVTLARFLVQGAFMLPFFLYNASWRRLSLENTLYHAVRAGVIVIAMICFVATLAVMQIADAIAIFFVEPIILTVLASIFLKEPIGWRRYTACAVGFMGAIIVIRPSFADVGYIAILPVFTALGIAIFALITRVISQREDPWSMQFQMALWGVLFTTILLAVGNAADIGFLLPSMPSGKTLIWLAGVGLTSSLSGIFAVYAFRAAPASVLAPMQYMEIISATALGWWVFGGFPDATKWVGIFIIIGSGLYIVWRERRVSADIVSQQETLKP
ncbi:DMT family transporter [Rhizobium sp. L1K21]|uniref:DMT family transporter n=1 Tax=Rhizobium sp. L1K21 TaxID=2954933 RepID=UPI002092CE7C|nr:DMT family transporter [Rhizobium sp. L1K21]MCO6185613.1 DMT family transporter [Rhizobium sp. L1K21]